MGKDKKTVVTAVTESTTTTTTTTSSTTTTTKTREDDDEDPPELAVKIPSLEDIKVGSFTLVDLQTIGSTTERARTLAFGQKALKDLIAKTRETRICSSRTFFEAQQEGLKRFLVANPRATDDEIQDFRDTFDEIDDSECDPRLDAKALVVYNGRPVDRDLLGVFFLYNMKVTGGTLRAIEASALPAPGIPFVDDRDWATKMKLFMVALLETTLPLVDGSTLDLLALDFPTREGHAWSGEPWAERLIDDFVADGYVRGDNAEGTLGRFERKPPEPEPLPRRSG